MHPKMRTCRISLLGGPAWRWVWAPAKFGDDQEEPAAKSHRFWETSGHTSQNSAFNGVGRRMQTPKRSPQAFSELDNASLACQPYPWLALLRLPAWLAWPDWWMILRMMRHKKPSKDLDRGRKCGPLLCLGTNFLLFGPKHTEDLRKLIARSWRSAGRWNPRRQLAPSSPSSAIKLSPGQVAPNTDTKS